MSLIWIGDELKVLLSKPTPPEDVEAVDDLEGNSEEEDKISEEEREKNASDPPN